MRNARLCFIASLLSTLPVMAAPVVSFGTNEVVVSQLTPGSSAAIAGFSRNGSTVYYRLSQLKDEDGDGIVHYDFGSSLPSVSVFVAVDLADGGIGAARPTEAFLPIPLPLGQIVADALGQPIALQYLTGGYSLGLVLVVRPGIGAWGGRLGDGGIYDADDTPNGVYRLAPSRLPGIDPGSPPAPAAFQAGDVVVEIEPNELNVTAGPIPSSFYPETIGFTVPR